MSRTGPRSGGFAYRVLKSTMGPVLRRLYPIELIGFENVPATGPVILAINHRSFMDSMFVPAVLSRPVTFVAKAEYFESWKTRWFFTAMGQIPVKRGGGEASQAALDAAAEVLREGEVFGIYPEGTRSPDGRLYKGRTGVARLALDPGAVVVAVGLQGTDAVQPIGKKMLRFRVPVIISFSRPLDFSRLRSVAETDPLVLRRVTDEIMFEIRELCDQVYVNQYAPKKNAALEEAVSAGGVARLPHVASAELASAS
jgi:1-acyl-sn-glycerol-3-phosphate acyltransferase